jgi:excisionase family DNA binding protein
MEHGEVLMTSREVMELFHISRITLYKLMKDDTIPYVRLGGKYLFVRDTVVKSVVGVKLKFEITKGEKVSKRSLKKAKIKPVNRSRVRSGTTHQLNGESSAEVIKQAKFSILGVDDDVDKCENSFLEGVKIEEAAPVLKVSRSYMED